MSAGAITVGGTTPTFSLAYDMGTMKYGAVPAVPTDKPLYAGGTTVTFAAAVRVEPGHDLLIPCAWTAVFWLDTLLASDTRARCVEPLRH